MGAACLDGRFESLGPFFAHVFGQAEGYICIARKERHSKRMNERFFPITERGIKDIIALTEASVRDYDMYFCAQPLTMMRRLKESVIECSCAWADLDACPPENLLIQPTITIESSPGRYQAYWIFEETVPATDAEILSRAIAYYHSEDGADKSGWDLTQLLRIPFTNNYKYSDAPAVKITHSTSAKYRLSDFGKYSREREFHSDEELPQPTDLAPEQLLTRHSDKLSPSIWRLFFTQPDEDWSKALWTLELLLFEGGFKKEEVFYIAKASACNKYERDNQPDTSLWKDVLKAYSYIESKKDIFGLRYTKLATLVEDEEEDKKEETFVEQYIKWAETQTDAAPIYHQAGAFMILSGLLSGVVRLPTTFNPQGVVPNLWFLILGDTTLTRKSTAMDMALDLLLEVSPAAMVATDASIEGLFATLASRPGQPSLFVRDEFSGMLEMMAKKDYYAGMVEALTKLYDGRRVTRQLARSTIDVQDPIFIMFTGGIRSRIMKAMHREWIDSGFLPRFLFFSARSDVSRLQDLGPPMAKGVDTRAHLVKQLQDIAIRYTNRTHQTIGHVVTSSITRYTAKLTPAAWKRYNETEHKMLEDAVKSAEPDLFTPISLRLAMSFLKASVLLAACRPENPTADNEVIVTKEDLIDALRYGAYWRDSALEVAAEAGATVMEQLLGQVTKAIDTKPGITRAQLMRTLKLTTRDADQLFATLTQRGVIRWEKHQEQAAERFYPLMESV
jgi:hypothetical protein